MILYLHCSTEPYFIQGISKICGIGSKKRISAGSNESEEKEAEAKLFPEAEVEAYKHFSIEFIKVKQGS